MKATLYDLHPGDLVLCHSRLYRVVMVRAPFVTVRDSRHDIARFHIDDVELAGVAP